LGGFLAPTYQVKIHKIPTPYLVGPVDIFELWGAGKHLLVDTGPPTKEARDYLSSQIDLASLDYLLLPFFLNIFYFIVSALIFLWMYRQAQIHGRLSKLGMD